MSTNGNKKRQQVFQQRPSSQAKGRTAARSRNRWEREAEQSVGKMRRGEQNIATQLTVAPTASYSLASSLGQALPNYIRQPLEEQFGADLRAVRIHSNAYAAAAARQENARAFAAGRDIFFGQNEYQPHSQSGQDLLVHELTHVLQQTGRQKDGQLIATPSQGDGPLQYVIESPLTGTSSPEMDELARLHIAATQDADVTERITDFAQQHETAVASQDEPAFWNVINNQFDGWLSNNTLSNFSTAFLSFLYDAFKFNSDYVRGAKLLLHIFMVGDFTQIESLYYSNEAYEAFINELVRRFGEESYFWILRVWEDYSILDPLSISLQRNGGSATINNDAFNTALLHSLTGRTRSNLTAATLDINGRHQSFHESAKQILRNRNRIRSPKFNELFYVALWALDKFERLRTKKLNRLARDIAPNTSFSELNFSQRLAIARNFSDFAGELAEGNLEALGANPQAELQTIVELVGPSMKTTADFAVATLERILNFNAAVTNRQLLAGVGDPANLVSQLSEMSEYNTLLQTIFTRLSALLALPNGELPAANTYHNNRLGASQIIKESTRREVETPYLQLLSRLASGRVTPTTSNRNSLLIKGWLMSKAAQLVSLLNNRPSNRIDTELDVPLAPATGGEVVDIRIAHRIRVASWLLDFGYRTNHAALEELAGSVLRARQEDQTESQLSMLGIWQEVEDVSVNEITNDFRGNATIGSLAPLRFNDIRRFFTLQFYQRFTRNVNSLAGTFDQNVSNVSRAYTLTKSQLEMPRKFVMDDYELAVRPEQEESINHLISSHPKYIRKATSLGVQLSGESTPHEIERIGLLPTLLSQIHESRQLYFWTIPPMDNLAAELQAITELQQLVDIYREAQTQTAAAVQAEENAETEETTSPPTATEEEEASPELPSWLIWLVDLNNAINWWQNVLTQPERDVYNERFTPGATDIYSVFDINIFESISDYQEGLSTRLDLASDQLKLAQRNASRQERSQLVDHKIQPLLDHYDPDTIVGHQLDVLSEDLGGGLVGNIPSKIIGHFFDIGKRLYPRNDRPLHQVAILLELANQLEEKFSGVNNFGILNNYIPRLSQAIELAEITILELNTLRAGSPQAESAEPNANYEGLRAVLKSEHRNAAWLTARKDELVNLKAAMVENLSEQQQGFGFVARKSANGERGFVDSVGPGMTIFEGDSFVIDGYLWQLREVLADFTYYPRYGSNDPVMEPGDLTSGVLLVKVINNRANEDGSPASLDDADELIIDATDHALLKEFTNAVQMHAIVAQLNELADFIEGSMELAMAVAEFTPIGWAVVATQVFSTIMAFVEGGDFDNFIQQIRENELLDMNAEQLRDYLFNQVQESFEPENLLAALLFGDASFFPERLGGQQEEEQPRGRRRRGVGAKLARLGGRLAKVGGALNRSVVGLQRTVDFRMSQTQVFFLGHPLLARLFGWLAEYFPLLVAAGLQGQERIDQLKQFFGLEPGDDLETHLGNIISNGSTQLATQMQDFVNGLSHIEVPAEILPLDEVVDLVLDILIDRLGKKGELIGEGLRLGLETTGHWGQLTEAIGDKLRNSAGDPNRIWRELVIPELNTFFGDKLTNARIELVTGLNSLSPQIPFVSLPSFTVPDDPVNVEAINDFEFEEPEAESFNGQLSPNPNASTSFSGSGQALNRHMKRSTESRFGHDFSHVRLHQDAEAKSLTRNTGSEALTSGSHIFLRPGLSYQSNYGRRVIHHELTHVLQQTGERHLGKQHRPEPQKGSPGKGLSYRPQHEQEAEHVAKRIDQGQMRGPVSVQQGKAAGLQPSLGPDFMSRLLDKMVSAQELTDNRQDIESEARNRPTLPNEIRNSFTQLQDALWEPFTGSTINRSHFGSTPMERDSQAREDVAHVLANARADLRQVLPAIASRAKVNIPNPNGNGQVVALRRSQFEVGIVRYLFARTGVLLDLKLKFEGSGQRGRVKGFIDTSRPISQVNVRYLNIAKLAYSGTEKQRLWDKLISSFSANYRGTNEKKIRLRAAVRRYIQRIGLSQDVWINSSFSFNVTGRREVTAIYDDMERGGAKQLAALDLPVITDYINTDGNSSGSIGHIGLRLGVHDHANQKGDERESHHLTQYLLMEYFRNEKDRKPFPFLTAQDNPYPGLNVVSEKPTDFRNAGNTIDILGLGPNTSIRGGKMPAILIARRTHRTGRLHVTGNAAEDFPGTSSESPSAVVDHWFKTSLGPGFDTLAQLEALKAQPQGDDLVKDKVYTAMQTTYKKMRRLMMRQLEPALKNLETDYYNLLAEEANRTGQNYHFSESRASRIKRSAERFNDDTMGGKGWDHQQGT